MAETQTESKETVADEVYFNLGGFKITKNMALGGLASVVVMSLLK